MYVLMFEQLNYTNIFRFFSLFFRKKYCMSLNFQGRHTETVWVFYFHVR